MLTNKDYKRLGQGVARFCHDNKIKNSNELVFALFESLHPTAQEQADKDKKYDLMINALIEHEDALHANANPKTAIQQGQERELKDLINSFQSGD